jgi:elongation factor G
LASKVARQRTEAPRSPLGSPTPAVHATCSFSPGEPTMGHSTDGIRNIALVGAAGAGKTLLAESLLLEAGAIRTKGSLQRGSTVSDFDPQERALQHSLDPAILTFDCGSTRIHLIDTPGYADFIGRTLSVLEAVEAVAVVVSATGGPDA